MKKINIVIFVLAVLFILSACGAKTIDISTLSKRLVEEGEFSEKLSEVPLRITEKRYDLSDKEIEEGVAYSGTNAVVDEVAIFKAKDTDSVKEKVMKHIEAQEEIYKSYAPDEVSKLNDCIVEVKGDYVILCVSENPSSAEKIIEEYVK